MKGALGRHRLTVLLVDDDAAWRNVLKTSLEREGLRAVLLARADWIVPALELYRPDVVVLDVQLPGANGLDVLEDLLRRWPRLSVIVMTAFGGQALAERSLRLGAAAYLGKPFRIADLVAEIRRVASPGDHFAVDA